MGASTEFTTSFAAVLCIQVAWNKAELSAHDMEPEQQERLFAGKLWSGQYSMAAAGPLGAA